MPGAGAGGEQVSVRLTGGGPYGLRIAALGNGLQHQLVVAKLHKRSKARAAGVRIGDVVLSINGDRCQRMTQETANQLIDYSYDLSIQLLRNSDDQIHPSVTSSFRHSPQPPVSPSPSPVPFYSASEFSTIGHTTATELFRHQVRHHDNDDHLDQSISSITRTSIQRTTHAHPPAIKVTSHLGNQESLPPQQPTKRVRWSGCGLEPGMTEEESGRDGTSDWKDGRGDGLGRGKWTPTVSDEVEGDGETYSHSSLRHHLTTSTTTESQPQMPTFQPTQTTLTSKQKPLLWQPSSTVLSPQTDRTESAGGVEPRKLRSKDTTQPLDNLVHEVVIWSSKPTETEQREGDRRKPLPWQQSQQPEGKSYAPLNEVVAPSLASRQIPNRWQPTAQQTLGNLDGQDDLASASKLPAWQSPLPTENITKERSPSWQGTPTKAVDVLTSEQSQPSQPNRQQHRWQPTQPLGNVDQSADQRNRLEEPTGRGSLRDGSSSPVVTSLFLTRVVTDGSVIAAGSDVDNNRESAITETRKLYGDSSFYEDPEHKYPTIVEQIKMARKVALLLTSPENSNARGQRMFLKRKEQSSKWVIDTLNHPKIPHLFVSPPQLPSLYSPIDSDQSRILSPGEVERMRYHEEKSRHDVIPFDVCSMLATELREEKGRGGRMFAKRRDKADQSITPETNGLLIRVQSPRPEQRSRFVPEVAAPFPAPIIRAEAIDDVQRSVSVPVNRLKGMVDLPKPRITPWDSAVEYGTVEPAFEHLSVYRSYPSEQAPVAAAPGPSSVLLHGGRSQEMFREGQGRHSNQSFGSKRNEFVEDRRTANYQSTVSEPKAKFSGVAGFDSSPGFIRQTTTKSKGHRPVHFDLGSRNFN